MLRKPHVCFVSETRATFGLLTGQDVRATGGAELQQVLIARALLQLGYIVTFLVADFGQPVKMVTDEGFTLIKTRTVPERTSPRRSIGDIARLLRAMSIADADIYYQRASAAITGITALHCRRKHKPFVFSVAHNRDLDGSWRGHINRAYHWLYNYGLTHADHVIVQTEDQLRLLRDQVGRAGTLIRSTYAPPGPGEVPAGEGHVLWVSNFRAMKRPEMFVELARRLPHLRFVMVGGPMREEQELFDRISEQARGADNLRMTGSVPCDAVGRYFAGAILFVNTSSSEGFPNTYLQAWCRSVPTIGTFDPDCIIRKSGLGAYCENLDQLAGAVDELAADSELRQEIGRRALEYVEANHSMQSISEKYDMVFTNLWTTGKA